MEQMTRAQEKSSFNALDSYKFCILFLQRIVENGSNEGFWKCPEDGHPSGNSSDSVRTFLEATLENVRGKWCGFMGCQDKIEDQESLNVFIQSLFSDADRLNMKPSKVSYSIPTLTDTTSLVSKYEKFTKIINQADDEMII